MRAAIGFVPRLPRRPLCLAAVVMFAGLAALAPGCRRPSPPAGSALRVSVAFELAQPVIGSNHLTITLADADGHPLQLNDLEVEGDMNHAGMKPSIARVTASAPGQYAGTIEFTMGGDWFLLLSGQRSDGTRFSTKVDVPGVKPK